MPMPDYDLKKYLMPSSHSTCCWSGISPETTTKSVAIDMLTRLYDAQNIFVSNTPVVWIHWKSNSTDFSRDGAVQIENDKVYKIHVYFSDKTVMVENLLTSIGEPDFVNLVISGNPPKCDGAFISYPQLGLEVTLYLAAGKSVGVKGDQFISGFIIGTSWTPKDKEWFQILWSDSIKMQWNGYREYCPKSYSR
ncbi:MAG: hypothetical protein U0V02_13025 [Anaerolineales bacterium]